MASKILVADDSIVIQKSIGITFAQEDYAVEFVGNGEDALQKLQTYAADLVLADVTMPKMGGIELSEKIRGIDATQQTPVLLLAGANDAMTEGKAKDCGANDFIAKPFDSNILLQKVKKLLTAQASAPEKNIAQDGASTSPSLDDTHTEFALNIPVMDDSADTASSFEIKPDLPATAEFEPFNLDEVGDNESSDADTKGPKIDLGYDAESEQNEDVFSTSPTKEMDLQAEDSSSIADSDPFQMDPPKDYSFGIDPIQHTFSQEIPADSSDEPELMQPLVSFDSLEDTPTPPKPESMHSSTPFQEQPAAQMPELKLSDAQIENIVAKVFKSVIENIAWEVVPDMAEKLIREEIQRLTSDDDTSQD